MHRGRRELLDQIFASEELFPVDQNNHRQLPQVDGHIDFDQHLPSIGENPNIRLSEISPDHAPVTAEFNL